MLEFSVIIIYMISATILFLVACIDIFIEETPYSLGDIISAIFLTLCPVLNTMTVILISTEFLTVDFDKIIINRRKE